MSGYSQNRYMQRSYVTQSPVGGDAANPAAGEFTRPAEESPNMRANVINNICKGTLEPDVVTTSPVPKDHPQVMKVQMKETTTIKVVAPYGGNPGTQVSADSSTGLVLVDWKAGPSTGLFHMGILDAGAQWNRTDLYDPGLSNFTTTGTTVGARSGVNSVITNKAIAIPYNKSSGRQIRVVSTNLAQNFTRSRFYSGRLSIISDTVQLNAAVAAGNVSGSVITETPGVSQNAAGDDCYSVSDIVNGSRWKPETVQAHSLMDGLTVLQGPDIPEELPPIDQINRNKTDGAWESIATQVGWDSAKTATATVASPYGSIVRPVFGFWISPWNINGQQNNADYLMGTQYNNGYFSPIPEMQMVSVRIRAPFYTLGTFVNTTTYNAWVVLEHVFATLNANGQLVLQSISDTRSVGCGSLASISLGTADLGLNFRNANLNSGIIDITSDPRSEYVRRRNAGNDPGKYIGTQISMFFQAFNSTGVDPVLTFKIGGADGYAPANACEQILEVCAVSLNTELSGPMTVVRYDEVAVGQNIRFTSTVNTDNLSKSALSVIAATDMFDTCYDINIYTLLNSLYFGPHTDFRCVWTNSNYKKVLAKLSKWRLNDLIDTTTQSPRTMQIAEAAGLFDGLKSFGRGLLGVGRSVIANPMVRKLARHAVDGAVAHIPIPIVRELTHHALDGVQQHFASSSGNFISQSGDTEGCEAGGYFGDQSWQ